MAEVKPLQGQVALVAGATRGAGRGIARMLGAAGATVYCTGRSSKAHRSATDGRPETIDDTAELMDREGGKGIAVRVDYTVEGEVVALIGRIKSVNDIDGRVPRIWHKFDSTADEIVARAAPLDGYDRLFALSRYCQIRRDPLHYARAAKLAERLGIAGAGFGLQPVRP